MNTSLFSSNDMIHSLADAIMFLPAVICVYTLFTLIVKHRYLNKSQRLLIPVLVCSMFFYVCTPMYMHNYAATLSKIFIADALITLPLYGAVFLFLRSLVVEDFRIRSKDYLWFVAPIFISLAAVFFGGIIPFDEMESCAYSFFSDQDISVYFTDARFGAYIVIVLYGYYIAFEVLFWCAFIAIIYFFIYLYRHRAEEIQRYGKENYIHKFRIFLYMGGSFLFQEGGEFYFFADSQPNFYVEVVFFLLLSACFLRGCYHLVNLHLPQQAKAVVPVSMPNLQPPAIPIIENDELNSKEKYLQNKIQERSLEVYERLETLMVKEHLFKTPSLKCEEVARRLSTNRTYLTEILKTHCGCTFTEYIARYRVQYAESYMMLYPQEPVQKIAAAAGFASVETFWRTFKKVTGHTPKAKK